MLHRRQYFGASRRSDLTTPRTPKSSFRKIINLISQKVTFFSRFWENRDIFELPGALKLLISIFVFFEKHGFYLAASIWITTKSLVLEQILHLKSMSLTWFQKVKKAVKKWKSDRSENFSSVSAWITFGWNRRFGTRSGSKIIQIWLVLIQNRCDWSDHSR